MLAETPYASAHSQTNTPNGPSPASSHVSGSPRLLDQPPNESGGSPGNGELENEKEGAVVSEKSPTFESAIQSPGLSQSFPGATGYLANRWNASTFSTPSSAAHEDSFK